jgi:hypothetical protein
MAALCACGRINYEPVPLRAEPDGGPGSGEDAELAGDSADQPDAFSCPPGTPFSAPAVLTIEGLEPDLYGPRLAQDGLTLFLSQTHGIPFKDEDIFTATRASGGPGGMRFGAAVRVDQLASTAFDGSAFPSRDELEIFFSSARPGGQGNRDLWLVRRDQTSASFGAPTPLAMVNSSGNDQNPSLTDDGLLLFFASDRGGDDDIYVSFRTSKGATFSRPIRVPGLTSPAKDSAPYISADGRTIYFTSDRPGGRGGLDLWSATRGNLRTGFDAPTPVPGVSSPGHDEDPSVSHDGRELYFSSNRAGKDFVIYRAVRCF